MPDENTCPSTYSPGRAVVMTTPFDAALASLKRQVGELDAEPSPRTIEALLVLLEQMVARMKVASDVPAWERAVEGARHALSSGDGVLAAEILRDSVARSVPK